MNNAKIFSIELDKAFDKTVTDNLLLVKRKLALQALGGVTEKMPVDTGRARANTIVSIGQLDGAVTDSTDKNGTATTAAGQATILGDSDPFEAVYIQNNLPYINRLENGHSNQAPLGMFALTVQELKAQFT